MFVYKPGVTAVLSSPILISLVPFDNEERPTPPAISNVPLFDKAKLAPESAWKLSSSNGFPLFTFTLLAAS